jgi:predicted ribosome quality control (RQC) complex YloA/Tae2 family protein
VHNSYFVLRQLGTRLNEFLPGCRVHSCYSQDKDELVIQFVGNQVEYFLHLVLRNNFSMIRVPESLARARKNSIDLFEELRSIEVLEVFCVENERCICIFLDHDLSILLKMFGYQSNVLVCRNGVPFKIFKNKLKDDLQLSLDLPGDPINLDQEDLLRQNWDFTKLWPALGGEIKHHIVNAGYFDMDPDERLSLLKEIIVQLENPEFFIVHQDTALPMLTLFQPDQWVLHTRDIILALNDFYLHYVRAEQFIVLKKDVLSRLQRSRRRVEGIIKKSQQRLKHLQQSISYRQMADLIMANMHAIPAKVTQVELPDFNTGKPITIKLKSTLSPQKNAEQYYRKSKNQSKEIEVLQQNLKSGQIQLMELESHIGFVNECKQLKELRQYANQHNLMSAKSAVNTTPAFRELEYGGFQILIGKSAANNDLLTQKYAHKDDLWLHAKDVKGSHVVIRQRSGHPFPPAVIEKAAKLAAHYSKRKQDSLCPVVYTPKKYVRKRKGSAPGEVVIEREQVIMVVPQAPSFSD